MFDMTNVRMKLPLNNNDCVIDRELLHTVMAHENFIFV